MPGPDPVPRRFPPCPRVAAAAAVVEGPRVLLVRRATPPGSGRHSLPGGLVELGETAAEAAAREVREEAGIEVEIGPVLAVVDRVARDPSGRVETHYVIVDYLASRVAGVAAAGGDADRACWVTLDEAARLPLTEGLLPVLERAFECAAAPRGSPGRATEPERA